MVSCRSCGHEINAGDLRCAVCNARQPARPGASVETWSAHPIRAAIAVVLYAVLIIWLIRSGFITYLTESSWQWVRRDAETAALSLAALAVLIAAAAWMAATKPRHES